jgi:O-antigen ligase
MDRARLDGWCERGILGLVLAILVFGPLGMGAVDTGTLDQGIPESRGWQFLVLQALTLGVMALWGVRLWVSARPQLLWPPVCWAVLAFVIYAIVRYWQADIEYVARTELVRILIYTFLFFAILNNLHRQEWMQAITLTLVCLGAVIAMSACWQFAAKTDRVWNLHSGYAGRASGTFIYPNSLAAFLEILTPLALGCVLAGRLSHVTKIAVGYAAVVMLAGIGTTLSRGGWLVAGMSLALLCGVLLFQRDYRLQALALLAALLLAGMWVYPRAEQMHQRFQNTLSSGRADDMRLAIWRAGYDMWQDHFWWGVGPAHFDYRFRQYRPAGMQLRPNRVHNDYLNTLADWGVAGAALVASAWGLLYWGVVRSWNAVRGPRDDFSRKKSNKFAFLVGASIGLTAILLHSAIDFNLHIPAIAILVVTLMALLSSQMRHATERCWWNPGVAGRVAVTLVLLAGLAYLGAQEWRGAREYVQLQWRVAATPNPSRARLTALEAAWRIEPMNFETTYELGEVNRALSWRGGVNYAALAKSAIEWYDRGIKLNPYDGYNWLRKGMCLDWINSDSAAPGDDSSLCFQRAEELDPNGYFTAANIGWHYAETGDYAAARSWYQRSLRLEWVENDIAVNSLPQVEKRLKEAAEQHR